MSGFQLFRNSKKRQVKEIEPHEVFLDKLAQKKEEEYGTSKKRLEISLSPFVLRTFSFLLVFLFLVLFGRSIQLQLIDNDHFSALASRNISSISSAQLVRGVVYDRNYNQLVYNLPQYDLCFRSRNISSKEINAVEMVAKIIKEDSEKIIKQIKDGGTSMIVIKRELSHESLVKLQTVVEDLPGFFLSSSIGREYTSGATFAHILGYIGKIDQSMLRDNPGKYTIHDYVGKMGIERFYEEQLTRAGEKTKIERDASGNIISSEKIEEDFSGKNLVLTVDSRLQKIIEEKVKEKIEELGVEKATAVAIDPRNGDVLAMVSIPSFDNNLFRQSTQSSVQELFESKKGVFINRNTSATYPTGSIIKPLLAVAALEEGIITPEKKIHSPGYITIPNPWNPSQPTIFRDYQVHGWRDMREAIGVSSNVYFYAIGGGYENQEGLGAAKIKDYLNLFGWDEKTGIDLPGEKPGFIPSPEWKKEKLNDIWRIGDTYNLSIGQGYLSATPLQVVNSYAALINGGTLFRPRLLKEIVDDEGKVLEENKIEIIRENFASMDNLKVAKEGMYMATTIGTARSLQALPVKSGAKTGTSQTSIPGINNNWVTVFAPYDEPEIVITVMIEGLRGVTPVATHITRDVLLEYYQEDEEVEE